MLRRSSSFKRAVRARSASALNEVAGATKPTAHEPTKGAASVVQPIGSHAKWLDKKSKWQPCFAVLYCGPRSATVSLHTSVKEFTRFRAFPAEVYSLPYEQKVGVEQEAGGGGGGGGEGAAVLRISLAGLPLLCLQLPTDEIDAWRCTLTREPTAEAQAAARQQAQAEADRAATAAATAAASSERAQRAAAMHATLHLQTASLAKARDELGATTATIRALNAEFELMADTLQFEIQGIGRAAVKEVAPRAQLRSAWAASDDAN